MFSQHNYHAVHHQPTPQVSQTANIREEPTKLFAIDFQTDSRFCSKSKKQHIKLERMIEELDLTWVEKKVR